MISKKEIIEVNGEVISLTVDKPNEGDCKGSVLITPAFGITAKRIFSLSYFLTQNGFKVYRMDFRNHVGESSGKISDSSLSKQVEDVISAVNFTKCNVIVSMSLSARATLRALGALDKELNTVFIAPVVDVRHTLTEASDENVFEAYFAGNPSAEVLGYSINASFIEDCIKNNFETFETTLDDVKGIKGKLSFIAGTSDPWVSFNQVKKAISFAKNLEKEVQLIPVESASHKIDRNPKVALAYFEFATRECLKLMNEDGDDLVVPDFREIIQAANKN
ncbi:alpha/beta hydrolase family protein [Aureispira anguillae]|uniref:Alpha/beta hydrolase n=1 Tax=Aureispira anguillae TaxID=2864201 RepID=A0A915YEM4_9BACT|nr:hypothetical protein [Aureispira anguillae]BDS11598.1 hypothetical protein AsAng_0023120 [Aureispira anguillae]